MAQIIIFTGIAFSWPFRTVGAYQVANQLRKSGYTVQVVDYLPQLLKVNFDIVLKILKKYVEKDTIWIGFSTTFLTLAESPTQKIFTSEQTEKIKDVVLSVSPKCRFVAGGSSAWRRESGELIDTYIEGYSDISAVKFSNWCLGKDPFFQYRSEDNCMIVDHDLTASQFDFQSDNFNWHETDFIEYGEGLPIEVSRGCIFKCNFCVFPLNGKKKLDYIKDSKVLKDQLIMNYEKHGTINYVYLDDTHNDSVEKLNILYDEVYSKLSFKINFTTYLRLDLLHAHPDTIPLLKESGLKVALFGIETLNNKANKSIGKGLSRDKIIQTLQLCKDIWHDYVITIGNFIVGLPYETEKTALEWIEIVSNDYFKLDAANINALFLISNVKNHKWSSDFMKNPSRYGYTFNNQGWINNEGLTRSEACKISEYAKSLLEANNKKSSMRWGDTVSIAGLGYSWDKVREIFLSPHNEHAQHIEKDFNQRIKKYFKNLLDQNS